MLSVMKRLALLSTVAIPVGLAVTTSMARLTAQDEPAPVSVAANTACIGAMVHRDPATGEWLRPPLLPADDQVMVTFFTEDSSYQPLGEVDCQPLTERSDEATRRQASGDGMRTLLEMRWPDDIAELQRTRAALAPSPVPTPAMTATAEATSTPPATATTTATPTLSVSATTTPSTGTQPAPTATPSVTPTPTVTPVGSLLTDDFSDPSKGLLPRSSAFHDVEQGYVNGEYLMRFTATAQRSAIGTGVDGQFSNVGIAIDVRIMTEQANRIVGLYCRGSNSGGGYIAHIYPQSQEVQLLYADGTVGPIKRAVSPLVIAGRPSYRLELSCIGRTLTVKVDGAVVMQETDSRYTSGSVGIQCGAFPNNLVDCRFDNLVIFQE